MKCKYLVVTLLAGIVSMAGCHYEKKNVSDDIREGIRQHLSSLKTLNLSAMDINVTNVAVNGNTAEAQVEYTPKTGAPPGAGMRVSYSLEKQGEHWVVVKTNALGGAINHPDPGTNPHTQAAQGEVHGGLPNFRDLIPSTPPNASGGLPPGHPPVTTSETQKQD
jgi:hypothetical protein